MYTVVGQLRILVLNYIVLIGYFIEALMPLALILYTFSVTTYSQMHSVIPLILTEPLIGWRKRSRGLTLLTTVNCWLITIEFADNGV